MLPSSRPLRFVFDLEANALLEQVTKVHCLVLKDIDTKELHSFADRPGYSPISVGLRMLADASLLIGHNIICYDIPVLKKVLNFNPSIGCVLRDTLLMSRLRWPEMYMVDASASSYMIPKNLMGDYSLKAFAYRLNGSPEKVENEEWSVWTPTMQKRCEADAEINFRLWEAIQKKPLAEKCLTIEHDFQEYIHIQEQNGVPFHMERAHALNTPLKAKIDEIRAQVKREIPARVIQLKTKVRHEPFNPGSRPQIIRFLSEKYNWKPTAFTDKGNPSLDGSVLESLPYPEAKLFAEYFGMQKLLGMLSEGKESWFKHVRNGRIHGRVITVGAVTRRCTHSSPNLAQIPSARSLFGEEVRDLFYAPEGYLMVGADGSGLELRMLSHYLAKYDGGAYGREVIEGDVHTRHQQVVELPTRDHAKTFIYAFLYGAGDETLGEIWVPSGTSAQKKAAGKRARTLFGDRIPAYRQLTNKIQEHLKFHDTIPAIDGGFLQVRKKHAALNTLLQSAGSISMKQATVFAYREGVKRGLEIYPALHVHDEFQTVAKASDAEEYGKIKKQSITNAGEDLNFKCRLDGEYKIGTSWKYTH